MEKVQCFIKMVISIRDIGKMETDKEMEYTSLSKEDIIMELGNRMIKMEKDK